MLKLTKRTKNMKSSQIYEEATSNYIQVTRKAHLRFQLRQAKHCTILTQLCCCLIKQSLACEEGGIHPTSWCHCRIDQWCQTGPRDVHNNSKWLQSTFHVSTAYNQISFKIILIVDSPQQHFIKCINKSISMPLY